MLYSLAPVAVTLTASDRLPSFETLSTMANVATASSCSSKVQPSTLAVSPEAVTSESSKLPLVFTTTSCAKLTVIDKKSASIREVNILVNKVLMMNRFNIYWFNLLFILI